jgi:hypothetical protein
MKALGNCACARWHKGRDRGVALIAARFGFAFVCCIIPFVYTHPLLCCEFSLQIGVGRERGSDCCQHQVLVFLFLLQLFRCFLSLRVPMVVLDPDAIRLRKSDAFGTMCNSFSPAGQSHDATVAEACMMLISAAVVWASHCAIQDLPHLVKG